LKKRRGRKKFILYDNVIKGRLNKKDLKYLEKIRRLSVFRSNNEDNNDYQSVDLPKPLNDREERKVLEDLRA
jgi:hypothetical protein